MYLYQYVLLAGFSCLFFRRETRFAASLFLIGWCAYLLFFIDAVSSYKYAACATIELSIAYALNKKNRVVAYMGYALVLVNVYGLVLIVEKRPPDTYDLTYALLSIIQFLFLLARAVPNGISELHSKHIVVRCLNYDSGQAYGKMYRNTPTSKKNQCQAK